LAQARMNSLVLTPTTMKLAVLLSLCALTSVQGDKSEDLVTSLPGFENITWSFKVYSGFLDVPGPFMQNEYDSLKIHYQFHTSQKNPAKDPVATWHQGGPGGSSVATGLFGELGYFQLAEDGNFANPWAWNEVANMLYLDSPAGVDYSECIKGDKVVDCKWNDVNRGEAYAHTLQAFYKAFPEFQKNDLYLTGESYFGQYGPNIAHFILNHEPFKTSLPLKGLALGNACWGGNATLVACNGPSEDRIDVDLYYGKGLFSPHLKGQIDKTCEFPKHYITGDDDPSGLAGHQSLSKECKQLLKEMHREVGPHNIYNIYDNCPDTEAFLNRAGKDLQWLRGEIRKGATNPDAMHKKLTELNGGYQWACPADAASWLARKDVQKALHLNHTGQSAFDYDSSGPASITLYPELVKKLRILIFNGDADACVPYNGNLEWISSLEDKNILTMAHPWTPWFTNTSWIPAGYRTKYAVVDSEKDFTFMTIRLAGHMVPQYRPEPALVMIKSFLQGPDMDVTPLV